MSKGADLAEEFGIVCKQALFSSWGNFYAAITDFPCVLFDEKGFVVITSKSDLEVYGIKVAKRTNVPHRIETLPTYQLLSAWRVRLPEELPRYSQPSAYFEGALVSVTVNRYERDRKARMACIAHYGCKCHVCGIKLSEVYGPSAEGFIHIHHVTPIASVKAEYALDPIRDLRPLCPNCHAIAHLRREPYSVEELQAMLTKQKSRA